MDDAVARARYDATTGALHIDGLRTTDAAVLREAGRWRDGERGLPVDDINDLDGVDLTPFAQSALAVGSRVLAIAAESSDTLAVQRAVQEAGQQVDQAVAKATAAAQETTRRTAEELTRTAREVHEGMTSQVVRLLGGENPELLDRLRPVLAKVGTDLQVQMTEGLAKAREAEKAESDRRHAELASLIRDVQQDVAVRIAEEVAANAAAADIKGATTLKGFDYEDQLHRVLSEVAAGLGDEYQETGDTAGRLPRNKKGDGVLHVSGGIVRVVFEAHDGASKEWGSYLAEAERNRGASASIGLVRRLEDNGGHVVRVIAPKRLVLAFDPEDDDPALLRTVVLLLRTVALTSTGHFEAAQVATANSHVIEALSIIEDLDEAKRSAAAINGHVEKVERVLTKTMAAVQRELHGATNALTGAGDQQPSVRVIEVDGDEPLALGGLPDDDETMTA